MKKAYQIIAKEHNTVITTHFVFADDEEEAIKKFNKQETLKKNEEVIAFTEEIEDINQVECNLVEEENEYTKNYPKKEEEEQRTLD